MDFGENDLFVSVGGSDTFTGRRPDISDDDGPFRSIERARHEIQSIKRARGLPEGGITVWVFGGEYHLDRTITLSTEDSGTATSPIVYRAVPGEDTHLIGGVRVTDFSEWKGEILQADLASAGIHEIPEHTPKWRQTDPDRNSESYELYVDGVRQTAARWPNPSNDPGKSDRWDYIEHVNDDMDALIDRNWSSFGVRTERIKNWKHNVTDMQVRIFTNPNWSDDAINIERIDNENRTIHLGPTETGSYHNSFERGARYYIKHVLEELDTPGEYYIDRKSLALYYWPLKPMDTAVATVTTLESVLEISEANHVSLVGFTVECARGCGVVVSGGTGVSIDGCVIRGAGSWGVYINGGYENRVRSCDIYDTGRGGVYLKGGDRLTLEEGRNSVENCDIHDYGRIICCYKAGVKIHGVANRVSHCHIHHAGHFAIVVHHGCDNIVEYCEINDVCLETADTGAVYLFTNYEPGLGNLTMWGNVLRHNIFHDISGYGMHRRYGRKYKGSYEVFYETPYACWAIYMDDFASGITVTGNVFYRCPLAAIELGGGRGNVIENNIIVDCIPAIHMSSRFHDFNPESYPRAARDALEYVKYDRPPYSERFPLKELYADFADRSMRIPKHNTFRCNVISYSHDSFKGYWIPTHEEGCAVVWQFNEYDPETFVCDGNLIWHDGKEIRVEVRKPDESDMQVISFEEWRRRGFDTGSMVADPLFVAPEDDCYDLRSDSPAFELGFKTIPIHEIGLEADEFRQVNPLESTRDRREILFQQTLLPLPTSLSFGSITGFELEQWRKKKETEAGGDTE